MTSFLPQNHHKLKFPISTVKEHNFLEHKTEAFSHLLKLPNKAAENNLGLSLVDIRVFPTNPFSPHANPVLGTNNREAIGYGKPPGVRK